MSAFLHGFLSQMEKLAGRARGPSFKLLQDHRVPLTTGERAQVMESGATWQHAWKDGKQVPSPAVWKAVMPSGDTWYVTNTHRAYNSRPTLRGAISRYHRFIKGTA